jgi:CheY-like chemotaxis protein
MHKRVLIAEENDTIRGVAETALRQKGYEVISVASTAKALEVLEYSLPDLLLVGADLKSEDGRPCFVCFKEHARAAAVPMLVLAGSKSDLSSLPPEIVIPQPFDPGVLLTRVAAFSGQNKEAAPETPDNPLGAASLDDDFLDAALGLDSIQVTGSEDMDKTVVGKADKTGGIETMTGLGNFVKKKELTDSTKVGSDSTKVESLVLSDDTTDINHTTYAREKAKDGVNVTSGIDIMQDQYGLADPDAFKTEDTGGAHDYDWFVNSMQAEDQIDGPPTDSAPTDGPVDELTFTDQSAMVDPLTPGPSPVSEKNEKNEKKKGEGVDKFIDEFKKEIERIRSDEPEAAELSRPDSEGSVAVKDPSSSGAAWEDEVEKVDAQYGALFARELMSHVAEQISEKLLSRLDSEKLLQLIKHEVVKYLKRNPKS